MAVGESQKVDKAPSPQAEKSTSEPLKPPSPKGVPNPASAESAPTSPTHAALSHDAASTSPILEPAEFPEAPPPSTQLYGLEATGGLWPNERSSMPKSRGQPRWYSCVAKSLWDNLEFVQAGFHIGWFVIAVVDTKADQEKI
jgi:hypothetical protein